MSRVLNFILTPLCWIGWHPMRAKTGKGGNLFRCERCGRFVKGAE